jgi:hypothetical protein
MSKCFPWSVLVWTNHYLHKTYKMICEFLAASGADRADTDGLSSFQSFFLHIYPYMPAIHPARFLARASIPYPSPLRPPNCLLYVIWALGATTDESYKPVQDIFYQRARKYAERDEMKSFGELVFTTDHIQTWLLLYFYEQVHTSLARGFLSARKAAALCVAAGLTRLDGAGLIAIQFLPPAKDWIELEERRRIFWVTFMHDRFLCASSGYAPAFEEQDVSNLITT